MFHGDRPHGCKFSSFPDIPEGHAFDIHAAIVEHIVWKISLGGVLKF